MKVASKPISPRQKTDPALATVLAHLREQKGLSKERLAHEARLTTAAYSRIEKGTAAPGWSTVRELARALDVSLRDLGAKVEAADDH